MVARVYRSDTANKRPDPALMAEGQLAINYESGSPGLFFKDTDGALVKVGPVHIGPTAPNSIPAFGGTEGNSKSEFWLDNSVTPNELKTWNGTTWVSTLPDEIPVAKLADGAARQLLQTDAAGTGVEWTDNIDVPGTLDVTGAATFDNNVTVQGDLTVSGTQVIVNTETVEVEDKNIVLGNVDTPSDTTADAGGITLKGATDKTFNWVNATDSWTSSENVDLASGKSYRINGTEVLSATALGSAVQISSANIPNGTILDSDINASAAIADTKLDTISTAGKVSNSATTATSTNTASTIVARDASGNFIAGTVTASLTGNADTATSLNSARTFAVTGDVTGTVDSDLTTGASISTSIASGVIVNDNVSASAAIAGTKISPNFGSQDIITTGKLLAGTTSSADENATFQIQSPGGYAAQYFYSASDTTGAYLALSKSRGSAESPSEIASGDIQGGIIFKGYAGSSWSLGAWVLAVTDGTPGTGDLPTRLSFATTADGSSSPTERLSLTADGLFKSLPIYETTGGEAANVVVNSSGTVYRSTSSVKYKTNIETLEDQYADAVLGLRPVWYRSTCAIDNQAWSYWGFIAEEVAEIDPRLVSWKTSEVTYDEMGFPVTTDLENPEPEGVQYDRFVPHLLNLIKRQKEQIEAMEARLSALEAQ